MSKSMTPDRAIEILKDLRIFDDDCDTDVEALTKGIEALEKQIPKKPVIGDTFSEKFQKAIVKTGSHPDIAKGQSYKCPVCQQGIIMIWEAERNKKAFGYPCKDVFCKKCGQALDWRDKNELSK
ncbi:MAG: hypothetical protein K2F67_03895, partial [Eubacterium sp.]|nr:hypothetical protein [Eubacterium sp.]